MRDYHINIFYSEDDEGYVTDIPDLNACSAFGITPCEALQEVQKAKELWLQTTRAEKNRFLLRSTGRLSINKPHKRQKGSAKP